MEGPYIIKAIDHGFAEVGRRGSAVGVGELADGSGSGSVEWKASQPFGWDGPLLL